VSVSGHASPLLGEVAVHFLKFFVDRQGCPTITFNGVSFANGHLAEIVQHNALLAVTGGSATCLSATDAWAEPLP